MSPRSCGKSLVVWISWETCPTRHLLKISETFVRCVAEVFFYDWLFGENRHGSLNFHWWICEEGWTCRDDLASSLPSLASPLGRLLYCKETRCQRWQRAKSDTALFLWRWHPGWWYWRLVGWVKLLGLLGHLAFSHSWRCLVDMKTMSAITWACTAYHSNDSICSCFLSKMDSGRSGTRKTHRSATLLWCNVQNFAAGRLWQVSTLEQSSSHMAITTTFQYLLTTRFQNCT